MHRATVHACAAHSRCDPAGEDTSDDDRQRGRLCVAVGHAASGMPRMTLVAAVLLGAVAMGPLMTF